MNQVIAWAIGLALAGALPAQVAIGEHRVQTPGEVQVRTLIPGYDILRDQKNPVPTRIEWEHYGTTANPGRLNIGCEILGTESTIRIQDGTPGAAVTLFVADAKANIALPFGTLLVPPNAVPVPGYFDASGVFEMPIDLGKRVWAGKTVYFQAMETIFEGPSELSWGMDLRFHAGNAQPPLGHLNPPLQAIPCKANSEYIPTLYNLLVKFDAASSYKLFVDEVTDLPDKTIISVRLRSPGGPKGAIVSHRAVVDLGPFPRPEVEVWVMMDEAVIPEPPLKTFSVAHEALSVQKFRGVDFEKVTEGCRCYVLGAVVNMTY